MVLLGVLLAAGADPCAAPIWTIDADDQLSARMDAATYVFASAERIDFDVQWISDGATPGLDADVVRAFVTKTDPGLAGAELLARSGALVAGIRTPATIDAGVLTVGPTRFGDVARAIDGGDAAAYHQRVEGILRRTLGLAGVETDGPASGAKRRAPLQGPPSDGSSCVAAYATDTGSFTVAIDPVTFRTMSLTLAEGNRLQYRYEPHGARAVVSQVVLLLPGERLAAWTSYEVPSDGFPFPSIIRDHGPITSEIHLLDIHVVDLEPPFVMPR